MRLVDLRKALVEPAESSSGVKKWALGVCRVLYFTVQRLGHDRCLERAATLSFVTILSLIPLSILFFSFAELLWGEQIKEVVINYLVTFAAPDFKEQIKSWLEKISTQAFQGVSNLVNLLATVSLLPAAVAILTTAERSFNYIWKVTSRRTHVQRFATFWIILTTSPFLLIASTWVMDLLVPKGGWVDRYVGVTAEVTTETVVDPEIVSENSSSASVDSTAQRPSAPPVTASEEKATAPAGTATESASAAQPEQITFFGRLLRALLRFIYRFVVPVSIGFIAFTVLYIFLPSASVRLTSAVLGGFVACALWEIVKRSFFLYFERTNTLYGQLAIVPLFLIWLYVNWLIVLIGCEITYVHQHLQDVVNKSRLSEQSAPPSFLVGLALLEGLARHFERGEQAPRLAELRCAAPFGVEALHDVAERLVSAGVLERSAADDTRYVLALAPQHLCLERILDELSTPGELGRWHTEGQPLELAAGSEGAPPAPLALSLLQRAGTAYRDVLSGLSVADLASGNGAKSS